MGSPDLSSSVWVPPEPLQWMDLRTVRGEDIPVPPSEHSNSNSTSCVEPRLTRYGHLSSRLSLLICRLCVQLLGLEEGSSAANVKGNYRASDWDKQVFICSWNDLHYTCQDTSAWADGTKTKNKHLEGGWTYSTPALRGSATVLLCGSFLRVSTRLKCCGQPGAGRAAVGLGTGFPGAGVFFVQTLLVLLSLWPWESLRLRPTEPWIAKAFEDELMQIPILCCPSSRCP